MRGVTCLCRMDSVVCVVGTAVPDELWTYSVLVRTLVRIIIAGVTALLGTPGGLRRSPRRCMRQHASAGQGRCRCPCCEPDDSEPAAGGELPRRAFNVI